MEQIAAILAAVPLTVGMPAAQTAKEFFYGSLVYSKHPQLESGSEYGAYFVYSTAGEASGAVKASKQHAADLPTSLLLCAPAQWQKSSRRPSA